MTRKCSHCSNNGHNSRTCPTRTPTTTTTTTTSGGSSTVCSGGVKLFGVRLTYASSMKKSASMCNLSHYHSSHISSPSDNITTSPNNSDRFHDVVTAPDGYLSDDPNRASCSSFRRGVGERKKGKPWTEEEHRLFLLGLQKLGKGDWRGIARNYVMSRTPTQVASHAQKYFIRQSNASRRKRRLSLFDMVPDMVTEEPQTVSEEQLLPPPLVEPRETDDIKPNLNPNPNSNPNPNLNLNTIPNPNLMSSLDLSLCTEPEPMEATSTEEVKEIQDTTVLPGNLVPAVRTFFSPLPYKQFWPLGSIHHETETKLEFSHRILKPTPVLCKEPVNVDELVGMSKLNLSETEQFHVPPDLSLNLLGPPSRQSAFHASAPATSNSELSEGNSSVIQAV